MTDAPTRTAIVTGGARGIGAAIAARLAADGMAVGVLDLDEAGAKNTATLITDQGGRAVAVRANVSDAAAFLVTQAAQRHMVDARYGRIVNISSTSALGNRGQVNYSAAKAGLQGFTKTLAIELGKYGVTANSVAPGFIETEMTRATAERMGITFEEFTRRQLDKIPVGRAGQPEDIAHLVSFLVSAGAGFVSGQVIYAAGGPRS